MTATVLTDN